MPPETLCPVCLTLVRDWRFEWHTVEDQKAIFGGQTAMECPACGAALSFDGFALKEAAGVTIAKRDLSKAARWARMQSRDLKSYLETAEGATFAPFWTAVEVAWRTRMPPRRWSERYAPYQRRTRIPGRLRVGSDP